MILITLKDYSLIFQLIFNCCATYVPTYPGYLLCCKNQDKTLAVDFKIWCSFKTTDITSMKSSQVSLGHTAI